MIQAAAAQGFARSTLYRARQSLGGAIVDTGNSPHDPANHWAIAIPLSPE